MKEYKVIESNIPFAQSMVWDLNRSYYQETGPSAWSSGVVPHNLSSNAFVGKTYAAMILGFLKDIAIRGNIKEKIYIVELGAGHGRLGFHILKHLDLMISMEHMEIPDYCYVLTDIVESNLNFFQEHPQLQEYLDSGKLDVAYYDGVKSTSIELRKLDLLIENNQLEHPIITIGNYFFDSIPSDLYKINQGEISSCSISVESPIDAENVSSSYLTNNIKTTIHIDHKNNEGQKSHINKLLSEYKDSLQETYLLIPCLGIECINTLKQYSKKGLMLLALDKGFSSLENLKELPEPELIWHGSFSIYVNFHAIRRYCDYNNGRSMFASFSDQSLQLGCLLLIDEADSYIETMRAYDHYVTDFGPNDYNGLKKMVYRLAKDITLKELMSTIRMSVFDSTLFLQLLPFIKKQISTSTSEDRKKLVQTLNKVNDTFFDINERINASYEIAGIFYDIGEYQESLACFDGIISQSGEQADIYYNKILCYYQLRQDTLFSSTLKEAKKEFPNNTRFAELDKLDLDAA